MQTAASDVTMPSVFELGERHQPCVNVISPRADNGIVKVMPTAPVAFVLSGTPIKELMCSLQEVSGMGKPPTFPAMPKPIMMDAGALASACESVIVIGIPARIGAAAVSRVATWPLL